MGLGCGILGIEKKSPILLITTYHEERNLLYGLCRYCFCHSCCHRCRHSGRGDRCTQGTHSHGDGGRFPARNSVWLTQDLGGLDSLYSIVQMPGGVPVAAVGIGKAGAKNAAILAVQILSTADKALKKKIIEYKKKQAEKVIQKDKKVKKLLKKSRK